MGLRYHEWIWQDGIQRHINLRRQLGELYDAWRRRLHRQIGNELEWHFRQRSLRFQDLKEAPG